MADNPIIQLSSLIARNTVIIDSYFKARSLPTPSLDADAPISLPIPDAAADIQAARAAVIEACTELRALMSGPREILERELPFGQFVSLRAVLRWKLDKTFPVGSSTTFEEMSKVSGLNQRDVKRIVRHGIYNYYLFKEPQPGTVVHSAITAALATDEVFRDSITVRSEELLPAAMACVDAMEKWPASEENNETGFSLANDTDKGMYEVLSADLIRGKRFANHMTIVNSRCETAPHFLLEEYPWAEKKTIVDVGGSHGSVAIAIAERFPNVKCIVQDFGKIAKEGEARLPEELKGRVEFMAHDFFTEQPIVADVYFFRYIFHNWSDKYCIKILQNLVPALRSGACIVVNERIMPDLSTVSVAAARRMVNLDLGMLQILNARQRDKSEWKDLFGRADGRFKFQEPISPKGADCSIIEVIWEG